MKPRLNFRHHDFYFGLLVLLLCSFCAWWLCSLCSCWYFSFVLMLLDVSFLFLQLFLFCCAIGVAFLCCRWCLVQASVVIFITLFFRTTTLLALLFYSIAPHTFTPLLAALHVVDPLALPLPSCCQSFHTALLALLLFSYCHSSHVVFLAMSLLSHFRHLLTRLYYFSRTTIHAPFALLLFCFLLFLLYFFFCCFFVVTFSFFLFCFLQFILCCFFSLCTNLLIEVLHLFFCKKF